MTAPRTSFIARHRAASALLLAVFLMLRGAIPPGMMPMAGVHGGLSIEICPSSVLFEMTGGQAQSSLPMSHPKAGADTVYSGHGGHEASGWDCSFGSLMASAVAPHGPLFVAGIAAPEFPVPQPLYGLSFGTVAPLPPSTGPPAHS